MSLIKALIISFVLVSVSSVRGLDEIKQLVPCSEVEDVKVLIERGKSGVYFKMQLKQPARRLVFPNSKSVVQTSQCASLE